MRRTRGFARKRRKEGSEEFVPGWSGDGQWTSGNCYSAAFMVRRGLLVAAIASIGGCNGEPGRAPADEGRTGDARALPEVGPLGEAGPLAEGGEETSCQPAPEERRACRPPLDTSVCFATWEERIPLPCGLRVYEGPIDQYLVQYISYADIPPLGGPSSICLFDPTTHALAGAWSIGHYLHFCCESSLDIYQGAASDAIIDAAVAMATHPPCDDAGDDGASP